MELGAPLEATGDSSDGEKALRRAVSLRILFASALAIRHLLLRQGNRRPPSHSGRARRSGRQMRAPVFGLPLKFLATIRTDRQKFAVIVAAIANLPSPDYSGKSDDALRIVRAITPAIDNRIATRRIRLRKSLIDITISGGLVLVT